MSETTSTTSTGQSATKTEPMVTYFYFISFEFSAKLPEPTREYFDGGYRLVEYATGQGFFGGTFDLPESDRIGRISVLNYAISEAIDGHNKMREARGESLLFDKTHIFVTAFDCGRNAL